MRVTDGDAHYLEKIGDLTPYLDEPWKSRVGNQRNLLPSTTGDRTIYGRVQRELTDYHSYEGTPDEVPLIMEHLGFDNINLLSHTQLMLSRIRGDDERMTVLSNAITDYMLDQVVDPDEGIYFMIPVPYASPSESVDLIDRVADERAVIGACMITAGPEPPLGNRRYDPIYEACQEQGLPVNFHAGGAGLNDYYIRGYEKFMSTHILGFQSANMSQLTSIIVQGIPEKFPDLEIIFQESGLGWVPMMMNRLDTEYLKRQSEAPLLDKRPSKYVKEFYFGTQPLEATDEEYLEFVIDRTGGAGQLLYASDYPHWDYDNPSVIKDLTFLDDTEKAQILSRNAEQLFGI